jgi:hypothetical protein
VSSYNRSKPSSVKSYYQKKSTSQERPSTSSLSEFKKLKPLEDLPFTGISPLVKDASDVSMKSSTPLQKEAPKLVLSKMKPSNDKGPDSPVQNIASNLAPVQIGHAEKEKAKNIPTPAFGQPINSTNE